MPTLSAEDQAFIENLHKNTSAPALVEIPIPDPVTGGHYKLAPKVAQAFENANADYKAIYGHDIPLVSAYRDPIRNRAADGAPNSNHLHGNALDIDRSAVGNATPFLNAHGLHAIGGTYHGRSEDNHFELQGSHTGGTGGATSTPSAPMALPQGPTDYTAPPVLQPGQMIVPAPNWLMHSGPSQLEQQQTALDTHLMQQAAQPAPHVALPAPVNTQAIRQQAAGLAQSGAPVGVPQQQEQPMPNPIQGVGNILNDVRTGAGNALNTIGRYITHPGDILNQAGGAIGNEIQHTQSPLDVAGGLLGGGAQGVADLINGITSLPADVANSYLHQHRFDPTLSIPTGDLQNYLKDKQASTFVGQLLPFAAAELLTGGGATPEVLAATKALDVAKASGDAGKITESLRALEQAKAAADVASTTGKAALGRIGHSATTGALYGGLNDTHGGGLAARAEGSVNMGGLGSALGVAGEIPNGIDLLRKKIDSEHLTKGDIARIKANQNYTGPQHGFVGTKAPGGWGNEPTPEVAQFKPSQAVDPEALTQSFKARQRPKNPGNIIIPSKNQGADLLNMHGEPINVTHEADLVKGSALPEGRDLTPPPAPGDMIPVSKSAKESADVFKGQAQDTSTAESLLTDASKARAQSEQELLGATGHTDPIEAQRALGHRILDLQQRVEAGEALSKEEGAQLQQDMDLLDRVLQSREQERQAAELLQEQQQLTKRSELPASKPQDTLPTLQQPESSDMLRSSKDIAMERADQMGKGDMLAKQEPTNDLLQLKPKDRSGDLVLPNREPGKVLEFPNKPTEPSQILGPSGKPIDHAPPTPDAARASVAEGGGQTLNPSKPITQEMIDAAEKAKQTLLTMAEAERHIKQHQPEQMPHFLNATEAGRNNQTLDVTHQPLEHGGRVTNQREVSPVGFAKQTISGARELENLRNQYEGDLNKVRDNLVQRLHDAGVKVSADEQRVNGNKGDITRLKALADKLPAEKRTHVYIMDHNLGETARKEGPYGFRRLDRITDSSLTGKAQELPAGTEHQNKIAPALQSLRDYMASSEAPAALKRVSKQLDSGKISKQSLKDLQAAYEQLPAEKLAELCKRFGL